MGAVDAVCLYEHIAVLVRAFFSQRGITSRHVRAVNSCFVVRVSTLSVTGTAQGLAALGGCFCVAIDLVTMDTICIITIITIFMIIFNDVLLRVFALVTMFTVLGVIVEVEDFTTLYMVRD